MIIYYWLNPKTQETATTGTKQAPDRGGLWYRITSAEYFRRNPEKAEMSAQ